MLSQQTPTLTSEHTRVACRVQTTPSYTKLSRYNTSIHAEGTAFAVDNEQHHTPSTPPSMVHLQQDSLPPCSHPLEIQEQPAEQTALSKTSTNHSNSFTYSGVTSNAVINERLRTQCATQQASKLLEM